MIQSLTSLSLLPVFLSFILLIFQRADAQESKCNDDLNEVLKGYKWIEQTKSFYQNIEFIEHPEYGDKCLDLDDTVQICASYRPHYHEYFVHYPIAYLEDIRRVAFIGGGDSMLLHEVLKYPSVEMVVGLELDQKVVRRSFQYFYTQPHFNDERVQWYFGDAAQSIMLLPKDYFGTFDLVLVDVSETVMSFSVSDEMNILEALSSLLKPEGIFVKNEVYFQELSEVFNYSLQLYLPSNPVICDQEWSMGSNKIDFFRPNFDLLRNNAVETLLYKPLESKSMHFFPISQYLNNKKGIDLKNCEENNAAVNKLPSSRVVKGGILMIIEAEHASKEVLSSTNFAIILAESIELVGLSPVTTYSHHSTGSSSNGESTIIIVTQEGIISASTWSQSRYCAFDIHLWSKLEKLVSVKSALLNAVESDSSPASYKFVVGGIAELNDVSSERQTLIGPHLKSESNSIQCVEPLEGQKGSSFDLQNNQTNKGTHDDFIGTFIQETWNLQEGKASESPAIIFCETSDCVVRSFLMSKKFVESQRHISVIWPCSDNIEDLLFSTSIFSNYSLCDKDPVSIMTDIARKNGPIGRIDIDASFSTSSFHNLVDAFGADLQGNEVFDQEIVIVDHGYFEAEVQRFEILDLCFRSFDTESSWEAIISVDGSNQIVIVASKLPNFVLSISQISQKIENRTGVECSITYLEEGDAKIQPGHYQPQHFDIDAYDIRPGLEQFVNQEPVASQSLIRFSFAEVEGTSSSTGASSMEIAQGLKGALNMALQRMNIADGGPDIEYSKLPNSDAVIYTSIFSEGRVLCVFDGKTGTADVNILLRHNKRFPSSREIETQMFISYLLDHLPQTVIIAANEEHPRGFNATVNYAFEAKEHGFTSGCWDKYYECKEFAESGECKSPDITHFMYSNCRYSCGLCDDNDSDLGISAF